MLDDLLLSENSSGDISSMYMLYVENMIRNKNKKITTDELYRRINMMKQKHPNEMKQITSAISTSKTMVTSVLSWAHLDAHEVETEEQLKWFKGFIKALSKYSYIAVKTTLLIIKTFYHSFTKSVPDMLVGLVIAYITGSLIMALILIGMGAWYVLVEENIKALEKTYKAGRDWVVDKWSRAIGITGLDKLPDMDPPEPPDVKMSITNISESQLTENPTIIFGAIFVLMFKACVAKKLSEDIEQRSGLFRNLLTVHTKLYTLMAILMYLGTSGMITAY